MLVGNVLTVDEKTLFQSLRKNQMTFEEVYRDIINFIKSDTGSSYKISIGTDSQIGSKSVFVTCIHVHRLGKGAIGFLHRIEIPRAIKNLREKIYMETCTSLQLAYLFNDEKMNQISKAVGNTGRSSGVTFEFHIDVGTKGETKALISEMVGMVSGLNNFIPRIKPDSYCASCFADRYTKAM